jgi:hypothetical protein
MVPALSVLLPILAAGDARAAAPAAAPAIVLFETGSYVQHKDIADVPGLAARDWLALCPGKGPAELRKVRLQVRAFRSPGANDGPKQKSGREVLAAGCAEPIALLRGGGLRPGDVGTVEVEDGKLTFAGKGYAVRRDQPEPETDATCGVKRVNLVLTAGEQRQVLLESDFCTVFGVRWAGDIDRDGKLDLLVAENMDSGFTKLHLLLSRPAPQDAAVKAVSTFERPF